MSTRPSTPIFDRVLVARRLARRRGRADFVTELVLADLRDRLAAVSRVFTRAAIIAPDATVMPERGRTARGEFAFERYSSLLGDGPGLVDLERLELPGKFDLIVSVLDLQIVDDVAGLLGRARRHLVADGLFMAAALGGATLTELRQAALAADAEIWGGAHARVSPFIDVRDAGTLLQQAGLALPVVDRERHVVRYASPAAVMAELRAMGAANPMADRSRSVSRAWLAAATAAYERIASDRDGRVRATLEIIWMSGWAPDPSQQKPMTPGSAKVSLRSVLKDKSGG